MNLTSEDTTRPRGAGRPDGGSSRLGQVVLWTLVVVVLGVVGLWLRALGPADGDRYADELAERTAVGIADDVEQSFAEPLDAENLAQRAVRDPRLADDRGDAEYDIRLLGWEGSSGDDDGARIELSITVDVPSWSAGTVFGASRTAGSSTSCWRYVVRAAEHDDVADYARIDCPDDPVEATPDPTPLPSLDPDAEAALLAALDALADGTAASDAQLVLQTAFPDFVNVRTERAGGELVATVGVARSRDCIVGVRPDGEAAWRFSAFDRILIEPGELGCGPGLYLRPVTTH